MRRRTFLTLGNEGIKASEAVSGDICLYNKTTEKLLIVESAKFVDTEYPSTNYSPVGVVVIPGSHNVYGTGECTIVSLKYMNRTTPDSGSISRSSLYWGGKDISIDGMSYYDVNCYVGVNTEITNTVKGVVGYGSCLPSDNFSNLKNPYDTDTYYHYNATYPYSPSPYNEDDTRNTTYYQTSGLSSYGNGLSDFDGVGNTQKILTYANGQTKWKTESTITNSSSEGYYPAACCCWRYHTDGTKQGEWYLPAMGELGYLLVKFKKINVSINKLINAYVDCVCIETQNHFSSTVESDSLVRIIQFTGGSLQRSSKSNSNVVRAFLRVK